MAQRDQWLGVDFGTSNSAAAVMQAGSVRRIQMGPGQATLPTTFFFDFETRETLIGEPANRALLQGAEGRFMRALKRVLGTSLMHEKRQILNDRVTFVDIIARFLRQIRDRAEAETGARYRHVLSGRPVVFHGQGDPREAQAEADLRDCYLAAGFEEVDFLHEPAAAAIANGALNGAGDIGLIVDIGGGTSDFSLFRVGDRGVEVLASHGVRIGGTDFDRAISLDQVMPHLGKGTMLRKVLGPGLSPVPNAVFVDMATWEKIPFLYTAQQRRAMAEMLTLSEAPRRLGRMATVLEHELGHELAFAVEGGKIAVNQGSGAPEIALDAIETGLRLPLNAGMVAHSLAEHACQLEQGAAATLLAAGLSADRVDRVIYVGGSSLMSLVSDTMQGCFPQAEHSFSEVFTAVADGLAIEAARREAQG